VVRPIQQPTDDEVELLVFFENKHQLATSSSWIQSSCTST
jgi:hypothetical protein